MNKPDFTLEKIKYSTDSPTFQKAIKLYESGKVTQVEEHIRSYTAVVIGTEPYHVFIEARRYDYGHCDCYLGQRDVLCKHMVALAIYVVKNGEPLTEEDKKQFTAPICSGKTGILNDSVLHETKKAISKAVSYIKPYNGPSRTWFYYQNSLSEGCNRLSAIISRLPVSEQSASLIVDLLLRLDKKLSIGGVDDSEGTVGEFMEKTVEVLLDFYKLDQNCIGSFKKLEDRETCFDWEKPLLDLTRLN